MSCQDVAQRLEKLLREADIDDSGYALLTQLREGKEPKLVKAHAYTLLHDACRHGWLDFVKLLVEEHNCDPHAVTSAGLTPLHYACRYGRFDIVRYLVGERYCDPDCCDKHQRTPLHCVSEPQRQCTQKEALNIVKYLVSIAKCDISKKDKDGHTALLRASSHDTELVSYLKPIAERQCDGDTALHIACRRNQTGEISMVLLEERTVDPNAKNSDGNTALHLACKNENSKAVQLLVRDGRCNLNEKDGSGNTPQLLHWAVRHRDKELVQLLVKDERCNPNEKNSRGDTALHAACRQIDTGEIPKLLLEDENIDPNAKNHDGHTPFSLAFRHMDSTLVKLLVRDGRSSLNENDGSGNSPQLLHWACARRDKELVQLLVRDERCNPHEKDSNGDTALHVACRHNETNEISKFLLEEAKIDPNAKNNDGDNPLHLAFKSSNTAQVQHLVRDERCNLNEKDGSGNTPQLLHWAVRHKDEELVKLLVGDDRCNPHEKDSNGDTALHVACRHNETNEISKFLLEEAKFDPNAKNNDGDNPLHLAFKSSNTAQVQHLVRGERCNLNEKDGSGNTPQLLHWAVRHKDDKLVKLLVGDERCNPHEKDSLGDTALHVACRLILPHEIPRHHEVSRLLLEEAKIDPNVKNNDSDTPLHLACKSRNFSMAARLVRDKRCNTHEKDSSGNTALHVAYDINLPDDFSKLLLEEAKTDPNVKNNNGATPLHLACKNGNSTLVKALVRNERTSLNEEDGSGNAPQLLHWACARRDKELVQLLVRDERCNPHEKNNRGDTALHFACRFVETNEVSKVLLDETKIDPNGKNSDGDTPLHLACRSRNFRVVALLVKDERCDPNEKDSNGDTALHIAFRLNLPDNFSKLLLEAIDPNVKNNDGNTALHLAFESENFKTVQHLVRDERCNLNEKDGSGNTPQLLHWAVKHQHKELVKLLVGDDRCNPHEKDIIGDTALHVACRQTQPGLLSTDIISNMLLDRARINPNTKNNDGATPLHLAVKNSNSTLVKFIVRDERTSLNEEDGSGNTPQLLHWACAQQDKEAVQLLVRDERCDPNEKDSNGDTALHVACRLTLPDVISKLILQHSRTDPNMKNDDGNTPLHLACRSSNAALVKILVRDERCNLNEKNSNGDTALHVACGQYQSDMISELLLAEINIDLNAKNDDGDTPLHLACRSKKITVVQHLASDERCNPQEKNCDGDTALHIACYRYTYKGRGDGVLKHNIAKIVLEDAKINPDVKNNDGKTPLDLTLNPDIIRELIRYGANPHDVYETHGKILGKFSSKQPLQTPVKLFMVGNPSAGKSTLTKALLKEAFGLKRIKRLVKVSGVDEKTAGIVPHEFESKKYGRVTLYDFAGQREFYGSHAALLQNAIQTSTPIFLLVVDLKESNDNIKHAIFYWLSFLENQCTSVSSKPHFVVIGSHADVLKSRGEDPKHKGSFITSLLTTPHFPSLEVTGFVAMDCQYADSAGIRQLHHILKASCKILRSQESIDFNAHCFLVCVVDNFREATALTLGTIQAQIKTLADDIKSFVPSTIHFLSSICDQLNDLGHLLVLKNPTAIEDSWVIVNKTALLAEVNGTIFAPEGFKEHIKLATSTGVVPLSSIAKHFPKHDISMLVGFLTHLEFCHEISDNEILALISQEQSPTATNTQGERYFFFPGLVTLEVPSTVWTPQPQFEYHSGWILQFSALGQFFYPRFVQVLLLRLAFAFAFAQETLCIERDIPALQRKCSVWKNGIYWGDIHGIETLVEIAQQDRVLVLMRCPEVRSECLQLRSLLIQKVLAAAREFCCRVSTVESFLNPSDTTQYPLKPMSELTLYSIGNIASVVSKDVQSASVLDNTGRPASLESLLSFEPYADLGESILHQLFAEGSQRLEIISIAERIPEKNTQMIKKIFKPSPIQLQQKMSEGSIASPVYHVLDMWRDNCAGTYQCLRAKLDQFSVFAGRNPLQIAGVSCESNSLPTDGSAAVTPETATATENAVVSPADVDMLAGLLSEVAAHWDIFLSQLGVTKAVRDELRHDNARMPKFSVRCLLEGLHHWVESEDSPTYGRITAALRGSTVCNEALAQRVEQFAETHTSSHSCESSAGDGASTEAEGDAPLALTQEDCSD